MRVFQRKPKRPAKWYLAMLYVCVGVVAYAVAFSGVFLSPLQLEKEGYFKQHYIAAEATILKSGISRTGCKRVEYSYHHRHTGKPYISSCYHCRGYRIFRDALQTDAAGQCWLELRADNQFTKGDKTTVAYLPDSPEKAVIFGGKSPSENAVHYFTRLIVYGLALAFGLAFVFVLFVAGVSIMHKLSNQPDHLKPHPAKPPMEEEGKTRLVITETDSPPFKTE
jgi:hypothetical protein